MPLGVASLLLGAPFFRKYNPVLDDNHQVIRPTVTTANIAIKPYHRIAPST
nr:hypothetical protein L204_05778 [Cryptococcus depauperatus CBS 7855]